MIKHDGQAAAIHRRQDDVASDSASAAGHEDSPLRCFSTGPSHDAQRE